MAYNNDPSRVNLCIVPHGMVFDYQTADPGKWFIGVVNTGTGQMYLAPVNPFEGLGGQLDQAALTNTSPRAVNRYASGVPADKTDAVQPFLTFSDGDWLRARPTGQTHHTAVATHYGCSPEDCVGFSIVKQGIGFGQMKCTSTSLNGDKQESRIEHSFSRATASNASGFHPGSAILPDIWRDAIAEFLRTGPLTITHLNISHD